MSPSLVACAFAASVAFASAALAAVTVAGAGASLAAAVAPVDDGADLSHTCLWGRWGTAVILSFYFPSLLSPLRHHFLWRGSAH